MKLIQNCPCCGVPLLIRGDQLVTLEEAGHEPAYHIESGQLRAPVRRGADRGDSMLTDLVAWWWGQVWGDVAMFLIYYLVKGRGWA